jgi:predicted nucleotidyltransferase
MGVIAERRDQTTVRFEELRRNLRKAEARVADRACVYATGSFGRLEAGKHSDLDIFIVGVTDQARLSEGKNPSLLNRLDEICVKADLIGAIRELGIPEFSGEGRYLIHYTAGQLVGTLGKPEDDVENTFTARLLLLLESRPLLESAVYLNVIKDVIAAYWRDYEDHKDDFMPAFLANDILRLWRTLCVNYESGTSTVPEEKKAKRKLKNYKLKHSRLLTCYSAILYLLAMFNRRGTVGPEDVVEMIQLTPTQRLEWLRKQKDLQEARPLIVEILSRYERFLTATNASEVDLTTQFLDKKKSREYFDEASTFGDHIFQALNIIGRDGRFYRHLVV